MGFARKIQKVYLSRHNFAIDAANVDASVKASFVVCINNITSKSFISANSTVVWALNHIESMNIRLNQIKSIDFYDLWA